MCLGWAVASYLPYQWCSKARRKGLILSLTLTATCLANLCLIGLASDFIGIGDLEFRPLQPNTPSAGVTIVVDADLPLTYQLSIQNTDTVTLYFPNGTLAQPAQQKLAAMAQAVGINQASWHEGHHTLTLIGPRLALNPLLIEGASPTTPSNPKPINSPHLTSAPEEAPPKAKYSSRNIPNTWTEKTFLAKASHSYQQGDLNNTQQYLHEATQRFPHNQRLWSAYGELLLEINDYTNATNAFRQALVASQPSNRHRLLDRLAVACRQLPPNEGYQQLSHVLGLYPKVSSTLTLAPWLLGELALVSGNIQRALPLLEQTFQRFQHTTIEGNHSKELSQIAQQVALIYELTGNKPYAKTWYQKALHYQPTSPTAVQGVKRLHNANQAIHLQPTSAVAYAHTADDSTQLKINKLPISPVPPQPSPRKSHRQRWFQWGELGNQHRSLQPGN